MIEEFTNNMEIIDNKKINSIIQYEEESNKEPTEEDFLRILKISEREIKYYLKLKHQEDSKRREKERELEKKAQIILKEIHNPALNILVNEFNFETQNAKELGDYMLKKGIIKRFPDHISTILLIIPPIGAFISFYHKYVIDQLNENRFRFVYLDDPSHIRKMKKIIEFSEIIIIDITLFLPKIYFILGLLEIYNEKTIIIRQDSYIPAFLSKYKTFTYDLDNYDVIKYDLVKLIKNLTSD